MTSIENSENQNYEILYKSLKEEYDQNKEYNEEINKEYESTIQILTESIKKHEKEKKDFENKINKYENDIKSFKQEKENLIRKNKDKLIDIQCLTEQNEKINKLLEKYKEEKTLNTNKIVSLENDVDHFENKIRECEDFIEELKSKLEIALEENITMQNEYGNYKLKAIEQLSRKEEEIKQLRDDNNIKDIKIKKLSQNNKEKFDIQKLQQKLIKDKKIIQKKRHFSVFENSFNKLNIQNLKNIFDSPSPRYTGSKFSDKKYNGNINFNNNSFYSSNNTPRDNKNNYDREYLAKTDKKIKQKKEEMNGLNAVITIKQNIKNKNNIKKKFEELIICYELKDEILASKNINNSDRYNLLFNNDYINKNELEKELKNVMIGIQRRKNELINLKKYINQKLAKLDIKIK